MLVKRVGWWLFALALISPAVEPAFAAAHPNQSGQLDRGFGHNGRAIAPIGVGRSWRYLDVQLARTRQGEIVAALSLRSSLNPDLQELQRNLYLFRYTANGKLNRDFGEGGVEAVPLRVGAAPVEVPRVAVDNLGRIVIAGSSEGRALLLRLLPDGASDPSFGGGDGMVSTDFGLKPTPAEPGTDPGPQVFVGGLALDSAGRILVSGSSFSALGYGVDIGEAFVARLDAAGELDQTFGEGGVVPLGPGRYGATLIPRPDGDVLFYGLFGDGRGESGLTLQRLAPSGTVDSGFGISGRVDLPGGGLVVDRKGRLIVAGPAHLAEPLYEPPPGTRPQYVTPVFRLLASGVPDTTFGDNGVAKVTLSGATSGFSQLTVSREGAVLLAGVEKHLFQTPEPPPRFHGVLARLTASGALDTGFGKRGIVRTRVARGWNTAGRAVLMDHGDAIVATPFENPATERGGLALLAYAATRNP